MRLFRDGLIGLALIAPSLVFILGGIAGSGLLVYGTPRAPYLFGSLPLPAALYGVLIFPIVWGLTEQMTYNGYLLPRLEVPGRGTGWAVTLVAFAWSAQHAFMPMTFDPKFMIFRALSPIPFSMFITLFTCECAACCHSLSGTRRWTARVCLSACYGRYCGGEHAEPSSRLRQSVAIP